VNSHITAGKAWNRERLLQFRQEKERVAAPEAEAKLLKEREVADRLALKVSKEAEIARSKDVNRLKLLKNFVVQTVKFLLPMMPMMMKMIDFENE